MGKGRRETAQTGTGPSPSRYLPAPNAHLAKDARDFHPSLIKLVKLIAREAAREALKSAADREETSGEDQNT